MRRLAVLGLMGSLAACAAPQASQKFVVFFDEWSAKLDEPAQRAVTAAAHWAEKHPDEAILVAGYADPTGSQQANVALSQTRAQVVLDALVSDGVARERIKSEAKGPTDYVATAQESRRVEIVVAGL